MPRVEDTIDALLAAACAYIAAEKATPGMYYDAQLELSRECLDLAAREHVAALGYKVVDEAEAEADALPWWDWMAGVRRRRER